ncbi:MULTISPECIES: sigma-70 family RNA polymerase sigma factor [Clostridium]|uniref:RNA polymerase subunit sigma-70 n=1 Tax=Clostridium cadaveris TaxID=1529 RepID=A0A1I2NR92_9CLOT|nr:sigma-70 family RNA polymerase sigma factor [Clostridium cadaveris]MDU4951792.1 sigma-70 family RNA polymerase sigma factor [Clostridium sp.]MDM8313452.1 sigma-70 family RNA polymerase sigma factor [Clostridium cadaveris]MDY4950272.1 sigma-70 family RNA polymerase sigma factor [Clostridium cadaveris]NME64804.1 sigma-70 family RNA polymerase sigma factor [Clostridium cadaveris]NWK12182.1 sigma-70 family RNA polymerase sigma factor [Clostridium cadaveris]
MDNILEVKRAIKGDKEAFSNLIKNNKEYLYKIAFMHVKNEDDALEVVHETVYKAFISIRRLKKPEYFRTWLTRMLINAAIDNIKKRKNQIAIEDIEICEKYILEINRDISLDLRKELDKLKDDYKSVITMKYLHDMKISDIAKATNKSENTVKTNLRRGLKILKTRLGDDY